MIKSFRILIFTSLFFAIIQPAPAQTDTLCTPNPSPEAVALFRYLCDMNGNRTLAGQMWAPWGIDEQDYVEDNTGKLFAIKGVDFIHEYENKNEVQRAIDFWNKGGIPTIMWHWGAPGYGDGYEQSKTQIDISQCFIEGTVEYDSMWAELKLKADHLEKLRDANVPVLWRPFHELDGGWFWWSMDGADMFKELWKTMFNYFVNERGLNNLIWVLCYADVPEDGWNPGTEYVDIYAADSYEDGSDSHIEMFSKAREIANNDATPIAYHECGTPPVPDDCIYEGAFWSWWMEWHTGHLTSIDLDYLNELYHHDFIVTLDELPNIDSVYGWDSSCQKSIITPKIKIDNGEWMDTNNVFVNAGSVVHLLPSTSDSGTWSWQCVDGDSTQQQQDMGLDNEFYALVSFTNSCGAVTSQSFNAIYDCYSGIEGYMKIEDGELQQTDYVYITAGQSVTISPQCQAAISWKWTGGVSDSVREITVSPTQSSVYKATITNGCGGQRYESFFVYVQEVGVNGEYSSGNNQLVYPVPFTNRLNIKLYNQNSSNEVNIELYTAHGLKVLNTKTSDSEINIDTSEILPGIYTLIVRTKNNINIQRVVKQ